MQSNTNKTKKTRKGADSSTQVAQESVSPTAEQTSAPRAKSTPPAAGTVDAPSPVKRHRRAVKSVAQTPAASGLPTETGTVLASVSNAEIPETDLHLVPSPSQSEVSYEEIAKRAYSYWADRGYTHGDHVGDWLRAENELMAQ